VLEAEIDVVEDLVRVAGVAVRDAAQLEHDDLTGSPERSRSAAGRPPPRAQPAAGDGRRAGPTCPASATTAAACRACRRPGPRAPGCAPRPRSATTGSPGRRAAEPREDARGRCPPCRGRAPAGRWR